MVFMLLGKTNRRQTGSKIRTENVEVGASYSSGVYNVVVTRKHYEWLKGSGKTFKKPPQETEEVFLQKWFILIRH
jgi:hypothetical protein